MRLGPGRPAHRALAHLPAFRTEAGRRYGRSTLESAADVRALAEMLRAFRGGDGFPPVWQANTIVAHPDWDAAARRPFESTSFRSPGSRRLPRAGRGPGLIEAWADAAADGVWWAELHGLHHLPETRVAEGAAPRRARRAAALEQ